MELNNCINKQEKGITYQLNINKLTAKVIKSPSASGDIFIPFSIIYNTSEYRITKITKNSFSENNKIRSITFPENSALEVIENESFSYSSIERIFIPPKVNELQDGWLNHTSKLRTITISPSNSHFQYDKEQNFIFGRTDSKSSIFDCIKYANRSISMAQIPPFIKHIDSYSFSYCSSLKVAFFPEKSELDSVGDNAFMCSSIIDIKIPQKVEIIKEGTFSLCKFLRTVEFESNSKLKTIDQFAFKYSFVKNIFIPEKVEELKDEWCSYTAKLTNVIISPMNKNFRYLDQNKKIIIGKSNDCFDSLVFANREIETAIIPSSIKYLKSSSFCECNKLRSIEFQSDSSLISIGQNCFAHSSLIEIKIPNKVIEIEKNAFAGCLSFRSIEIDRKSELIFLESNIFSGCLIEKIFIPKKVKKIGEFCFSACRKLEVVEIDHESELETIERFAFTNSSIKSLYIPEKVVELREEWCHCTSNLEKIFISPLNKNFGYLDEKKQIIIGKSSLEKDYFDTIYFACRNIETAIIPSKIEYIKSSSFNGCKKIKYIEFSNDSNLLFIGQNAFASSSLTKIRIPKHVKEIQEYSFSSTTNLHSIEFCENSELETINQYAFSFSYFLKISFPESVRNLNERSFECCYLLENLEFNGSQMKLNHFCFKDCAKLSIIAFPNATHITVNEDVFKDFSDKTILFVFSNANIIIEN